MTYKRPDQTEAGWIMARANVETTLSVWLSEIAHIAAEHGGCTARLWAERVRSGLPFDSARRQWERLVSRLRANADIAPFTEERRVNEQRRVEGVIVPGWTAKGARKIAMAMADRVRPSRGAA